MAKKINYAALFTLRKDGRYQGSYVDNKGRHYVYDRDPEKLWHKLNDPKEPAELTFKEIGEAWHYEYIERVAYKTEESVRAPYARLCDRFGSDPADEITPAELTAYLAELARKGYSKRSVQLHKNILSMIYTKALADGKLKSSPMQAVSLPRNLSETRRELPSDEALEAVKNSADAPFGLFALICLYAGLRRGEALALKYEDIDRENHVIYVERAVEFAGERPAIKLPKTNAGKRNAVLLDVLAEHIPNKKRGYIFANADGSLLSKTQYRRRWNAYCKYIGHAITAHQLRHGFATILYEAGIPDKDAQELLGHANITLTRDIYTHIRRSRRIETAAALNAFVSKK